MLALTAAVTYAVSPVFAPDGTRVAFINGDLLPARVLSVMDFDGVSQFSNMQDAVTTANEAIAWPSFLPDGQGLIYHQGDSFDTQKFNPDATAQSGPPPVRPLLKVTTRGGHPDPEPRYPRSPGQDWPVPGDGPGTFAGVTARSASDAAS